MIVSGLILLIGGFIDIDFVSGPLSQIMQTVRVRLPHILLSEVGIFGLLGFISSLIALRRYVRA